MSTPVILCLMLVGGLGAVVPFVYVAVRRMGKTRLLQPAAPERFAAQDMLARAHDPWAKHFGFQWVGAYTFRSLQQRYLAIWRHAEQPVFFVMQVAGGSTHYEFLSVFNRQQQLTTTSQNAIAIPRPPGEYVQRFPNAKLSELFEHHVRGHEFLLHQGHATLQPFACRIDRAIVAAIARQHEHVTAMPAWPLRGLLWVLVEPRRMLDRSVADQLGDRPPAAPKVAATPPGTRAQPSEHPA